MVSGLTSLFRSAENNVEMFLEFTLSDEVIEQARPQTDFICHFAI
jgi:hypothetical protein